MSVQARAHGGMRVGMLHPSRLYLVAITICLTCEMMYCSFRVRVVVLSCFMQWLIYNPEYFQEVFYNECISVVIATFIFYDETDHL